MKKVKADMARKLFEFLYEANMADVQGDNENDLSPKNANQDDLYGSLGDAIIALGYEGEYDEWAEMGEIPNIDD